MLSLLALQYGMFFLFGYALGMLFRFVRFFIPRVVLLLLITAPILTEIEDKQMIHRSLAVMIVGFLVPLRLLIKHAWNHCHLFFLRVSDGLHQAFDSLSDCTNSHGGDQEEATEAEPPPTNRSHQSTNQHTSNQHREQSPKQPPKQTPNATERAYTILGIPHSATIQEIKSAFRAHSLSCHPDKTAHLSEHLQQEAAQEFRRLRRAYQHLKTIRKF